MAVFATIAPFGFADFDPPTLLRRYRELGCRRSQFYRNPANPPPPAEARQIAADAGVPLDSMHGLFGPALDPSSPEESVRRAAVETYRAEGGLVRELGGAVVVVHPAPAAPTGIVEAAAQGTGRLAALQRTFAELAAIGEGLGVTYLFENLPGNFLCGADPAQLAALLRQFDHPRLRMCFDTGHANMTGHAPTALAACRDVVCYLHVHDNDGRLDSHLVPGRGTCPFTELTPLIAGLPATTTVMLELFEKEPDLAAAMRDGLGQRVRQWLAVGEKRSPSSVERGA